MTAVGFAFGYGLPPALCDVGFQVVGSGATTIVTRDGHEVSFVVVMSALQHDGKSFDPDGYPMYVATFNVVPKIRRVLDGVDNASPQ